VAEELLNGTNVVTRFQKVRGERMPKGMAACRFQNTGLPHGIFNRTLNHCLMEMMSAPNTRLVFDVTGCCRKHPLPSQFPIRISDTSRPAHPEAQRGRRRLPNPSHATFERNRDVREEASVPHWIAWSHGPSLPAKSGVGGGLLAVCPGKFGIAVVSPPLDPAGNSVVAGSPSKHNAPTATRRPRYLDKAS